ncbi:MAG: 1-acyl-sn-glycerol-3-phosphate acyltransferase [Ekhidna sp.]
MEKFVDVRRLIADKNPKHLKWLPGFVIRWIEKVIHQDELNDFMQRHHQDDTHDFCTALVKEFNLKLELEGMDNIPSPPERVIFVANHPLGGLDAITIIHLLRSIRPDVKFIVNDLLMAVNNLKSRFIGVNKVGRSAVESLQRVEEQFASGPATFIFPAGLVSRKIKGEIMDLEWKKTFVSKAKKYHLRVIPVHIEGRLTPRFYRLANLRKFLGLKFNIEMFFLVDELFKQKHRTIRIAIGAPINPTTFTKDKSDKEWAEWTKNKVYQLAKE